MHTLQPFGNLVDGPNFNVHICHLEDFFFESLYELMPIVVGKWKINFRPVTTSAFYQLQRNARPVANITEWADDRCHPCPWSQVKPHRRDKEFQEWPQKVRCFFFIVTHLCCVAYLFSFIPGSALIISVLIHCSFI